MKSDAEIIKDFKKYTKQIYDMKHNVLQYSKRFEKIIYIFEHLDDAECGLNQIIKELWNKGAEK